jgi:signal transduction histidine kinase
VRRSPGSSTDSRRLAGPVLVVAGVVVGLAAERAAFEWSDVRHWVPDLVVGLTFVGSGATTLRRRPAAGALLAATGFTWFLGNFDSSLLFLHRGPLVHLFVTSPGWRARSRLDLGAVTVGYTVAVLTPTWRSDGASVVLALALVAFVARQYVLSSGRARRDRLTALQGASLLGIAVGGGALLRMATPSGDAVEPMLLVYQAALCWIAVLFAVRLRPPDTAAVADLVVELGEVRSGTLRDALAATLGDPTLEIAYRTATGGYVDPAGVPVVIPAAGGERAATWVERDGQPFAVLVHDSAVLDDPALVQAVAAATRLSAANAALLGEVRRQVDELMASRRRLVMAALDERRRLAVRVRSGVGQRVIGVTDALRADSGSSEHVGRAVRHLVLTVADLHQLAEGLHPLELDDGLDAALAALAARSPVPVDLDVRVDGLQSNDVTVAAYYVCAEALANVAKHSGATSVQVRVERRRELLTVVVVDDGAGGAEPAKGSGLRGLTDRVEALGGMLTVTSPTGAGTRLTAELPLGRQSQRMETVSRSGSRARHRTASR